MNKTEILQAALKQRDEEVFHYQINIDNYKSAIRHIDDNYDPALRPFQEQLSTLLASEQLEQKKAKVMQAVIAAQLKEE